MLTEIIAGFLTGGILPLLPHVLRFAQDFVDKRHELKVMEMQGQLAEAGHGFRLAELDAQADIEESRASHRPTPQLTNADSWWLNGVNGFLHLLNQSVRPVLAYAFFGLYAAYKVSLFASVTRELTWNSALENVQGIWTDEDMALFIAVMMYYFSQRGVRYALERMGK